MRNTALLIHVGGNLQYLGLRASPRAPYMVKHRHRYKMRTKGGGLRKKYILGAFYASLSILKAPGMLLVVLGIRGSYRRHCLIT